MKVTTTANPVEPKFEPITVTLVCETPQEAQILRRISGMCGSVAGELTSGTGSVSVVSHMQSEDVSKFLEQCFEPLRDELKAQNIPL